MSNDERLEAVKTWYSELEANYRLDEWATIDPERFEELHKILYHIDFNL